MTIEPDKTGQERKNIFSVHYRRQNNVFCSGIGYYRIAIPVVSTFLRLTTTSRDVTQSRIGTTLLSLYSISKDNNMKVTLITGASGGIGEAFARRLATEKHNLLLVARSEDKLQRLCNELASAHGIEVQYVVADLSQPGSDLQLFQETEKRNLQVDWLINNAGIGSGGDFATLDVQSELSMLTLNIQALTALTHHYLQGMRARRTGTIVNISSLAAFQPIPFMAAYAASKAYVRSFTEAIVEENKPFGIHIMLLCPGATSTNFFEAAEVGDAGSKALAGGAQMQTSEEVVTEAMDGLRNKKSVVISGSRNRLMAKAGALVPNSFIASMMAKRMRPAFLKGK